MAPSLSCSCLSCSVLCGTESVCVNEKAHFFFSSWLFVKRCLSSHFRDKGEVFVNYTLWYSSVDQNLEASF